MTNDIGNYACHAQYWDWSGHDRTAEHEYWLNCARRYGKNVLIPMCAWGETGAYMAERGMNVTAFDVTPEMIAEGRKRYGDIPGLRLFEGDVRNFRFDIEPVDFCFCKDFGHLLTIEEIKQALIHINYHLRDGGALVIGSGFRARDAVSDCHPPQTFYPLKQVYPDVKVWKVGETRNDTETGRCYISQTFYAEDADGHIEHFNHEFFLQGYYREEWLAALKECGFEIIAEHDSHEVDTWYGGHEIEAVKKIPDKQRYTPKRNLESLRVPILRHGSVVLYNDVINLEQPNSGKTEFYRFDINVGGEWVGWIHVLVGHTIRSRYDGQIGYMINDEKYRNKGYATDACLALKPFIRSLGYEYITITTDENNIASRRVLSKIGATLLETVDTPTWTGIYRQGQRRTCIYEWHFGDDSASKYVPPFPLRHVPIDVERDRDYILERHCRNNYESDCPWARAVSYEEYRARWFAWPGQQDGFLSALRDSMRDERTIAEIIQTESGETVAYLWVPFHGEDELFIGAEVYEIYVEEGFRRNGIATYLMQYAEDMANRNGAKVIRSGTGCENTRSQGLHAKMGYYQYRFEYEKVLRED